LSFHFVPDDLCEGKFQCDNGQCIDRSLVCDVYHSRDCVDGSDEAICGLVTDYTGQGEVLYVAVHCWSSLDNNYYRFYVCCLTVGSFQKFVALLSIFNWIN